jgi:tetratricopeptide (TPR) repeat protein
LGVELAKSRAWRRDEQGTTRVLDELEQRFGQHRQIHLAWAQLYESQGMMDKAIERCKKVLDDRMCHPREALGAGLILKHSNELLPLIECVERRWAGKSAVSVGLERLYAYASVVTGYAPGEGLDRLAELWASNPSDGFNVADYATALAFENRSSDAEQVFRRGLRECSGTAKSRRAMLEAYARFLEKQKQFIEAHHRYRELIQSWPFALHNHRKFGQSLLEAAAEAHDCGAIAQEDACIGEAEQVLRTLLEKAPQDKWAEALLHRAKNRVFR